MSETRSEFGELGSTRPPKILGSTPSPPPSPLGSTENSEEPMAKTSKSYPGSLLLLKSSGSKTLPWSISLPCLRLEPLHWPLKARIHRKRALCLIIRLPWTEVPELCWINIVTWWWKSRVLKLRTEVLRKSSRSTLEWWRIWTPRATIHFK